MSHSTSVRLERKSNALSQGELADLLSLTQTTISRLEEGAGTASLETALGLQVIFDVEPCSTFATLYSQVEETVMTRAAELDVSIRGKSDPQSLKKQALLNAMVKRATSNARAL